MSESKVGAVVEEVVNVVPDIFKRLEDKAKEMSPEKHLLGQPAQRKTPLRRGIVGFTGTREGMTDAQAQRVRDLLVLCGGGEVHHGKCVGSDEQFNEIVGQLGGYVRHGHPCDNPKWRSRCRVEVDHPEKPPLERNVDVAVVCRVLIATPKEEREQVRGSGTWHTVRQVRALRKPVFVVFPDGKIGR